MFALNRMGWTVLFLSTRLTAPAYARLLELADCHTLIVSDSNKPMLAEIIKERPGCNGLPIIQRQHYRNVPRVPLYQRENANLSKEAGKMAWILHSSGSTGFPKPIFLTNIACLANFRKSFGLRCFCTSPLFHSHGLMEMFRAFYTKAPFYCGNHSLPVTSQHLVEAMSVAKPQQLSAVPYVLQLLAEKEEGIRALAKTKLVLFGGSSCPDKLGDKLVANGVNLVANYGCTEIGQIMTSFRPPGDIEWQYFRLLKPAADFTLMDEIAPGVFECVGLDGLPSKGPSNTKPPYSSSNPLNAFRTQDLFTRHPDPTKSNYYKYLARSDDRITLVNGEKVLPIPMEGTIRLDKLVRESVVFGFQRTVPGLLLFRSTETGTDLSDEEYLASVWPTIEAANTQAESFSRVPIEMVLIKSPDVVYPKTDKGTFIRAQVYEMFAEDIDNAYKSFAVGGDAKKGALHLDIPELEKWLLSKFDTELDVKLPSIETDIFSAGVDSLQTTRIWRIIKRDLDLGKGASSLTQNIVFEKGNIKQLATHLYQLRTGEASSEAEDEIAVMKEMIEKYSAFTCHFTVLDKQPTRQVVAVTGATGNLGAFIVAEMVKRPDVAEVWALVRAPGQAAAGSRLIRSLSSRGINLTDEEHTKLKAVPSDFSKPNLGLAKHDLEHLLDSLTCVVHSAWAVNFNLGVRSFEGQHIRGTYNLINFCLRTRLPQSAKFFFCSSVSAGSGTPKPASVPEATIENLEHAQGMGYGRSKLVTEHITRNAMRKTGIYARVFRIGQLSGDTIRADWNDTEAIALMIRSAVTTGSLPALDERPSWLPVDLCAKAITKLSLPVSQPANDDADLVYHLVNPKTFSFRNDLIPTLKNSKLPDFDIVAPAEWLQRLARSEPDVSKNPSLKLIDFWKGKYGQAATDNDDEAAGLIFETTRTVDDCPLLGTIEDPVSQGLIESYVETWMGKWTG